MNDPRAKQALYMSKKPAKSSLGPLSGHAIVWLVFTVAALGGAIWILLSLLK